MNIFICLMRFGCIYFEISNSFDSLVLRQSAAGSSVTLNAMPPGGKWGTECLNTRFPLPTLLCAGYSVKLEKNCYDNIICAVLSSVIQKTIEFRWNGNNETRFCIPHSAISIFRIQREALIKVRNSICELLDLYTPDTFICRI